MRIDELALVELVAEDGEVDVQAEAFGAGLVDEVHVVLDHLALEIGGDVDLGAHRETQTLGQRQGAPDDLAPVLHGVERVVDDAHLGAQHLEAQPMGKAQVLLQTGDGFLRRKQAVLQHAAVDPVAVLYRLHLILVAQGKPVVDPLVGGVGVILDMGVGEDFHAGGAHVVDILKAVLEGLFKAELGGVAVKGDASLGADGRITVHMSFLPQNSSASGISKAVVIL